MFLFLFFTVIPKVQTTFPLSVNKCEKANYTTSNATIPSPSSSPADTPSPDKIDNRDPFSFNTEADMRSEDVRLKTFENWPVPFLTPQKLAQNGFYYLGRGDEVRCAFCKVEIMRWMEGDDPAKDHQRWAPQCPLLQANKQANAGSVPPSASVNGRDECGTRAPVTSPGSRPSPAHPQYANIAARLRTYKDWPRSMPQNPKDLAEAGFYYTGQGDKTKCFHCDGGLKDWEKDDVPWEQHARWFDRCYYVNFVKGRHYVQKVQTESSFINTPTNESEASTSTPAAPPTPAAATTTNGDENNDDDSSKLCKICYEEERNIAFVPCGHICACVKCAVSTDKCPMCRGTIQNAIRVYFS